VRKADNLPPSRAVITKSGNLNFLETSGPLRACNGTALPFYLYIRTNKHKQKSKTGCGLSPVLFKIYINKIIQEFKREIKKGIQLNNRKLMKTILYAADQNLVATSEDELQTMAYHLNFIARK